MHTFVVWLLLIYSGGTLYTNSVVTSVDNISSQRNCQAVAVYVKQHDESVRTQCVMVRKVAP